MHPSLYEQSQQLTTHLHQWMPTAIVVKVCSDPESVEEQDLDITQIFPRDDRSYRRKNLSRTNFLEGAYFIPKCINDLKEPALSKAIRAYLVQAVSPSGCSLVTGQNKPEKCICPGIAGKYFRCERGRPAKKKEIVEDKKKCKKQSHRPRIDLGEGRCTFSFCLMTDILTGRRFFPRKGLTYGCMAHCGHACLPEEHVPVSVSAIPQDDFDVVLQQCALNASPEAIQAMYSERNGGYLTADQIRHIRRKQYTSTFLLDGEPSSPAERLVAQLQNDTSTRYVILTATKNLSNLITIRTTRRTAGSTNTSEEISGNATLGVKDIAADIIDSMGLRAGTRLLLCALWCTDEGVKYFSKFPTVLGLDTTFGTNSEGRPLARGTGKNMLRNNIPFLNCFVPSEARWVWSWIFQEAIIHIFPSSVLRQVRLILTDGDDKCYLMVDAAIKTGVFPNARHRLCAWHKINRGYCLKAKQHFRSGSEDDRKFVEAVTAWLASFIRQVESVAEDTLLQKLFLEWIDKKEASRKVSENLITHARVFWLKSFWPNLDRLCFRHVKCSAPVLNSQ
jgi:hypothetical protein